MSQGDSTAPAAISGLVALLKTAPELAGVLVRDGPELISSEALSVIMVASADEADDTSAVHVVTEDGYGGIRDREALDIRCKLAVLSGDSVPATARAAAYGLFNAVRRALIADPTLGGAVMRAFTSGATLTQDMTDGGARAELAFTVTCDAYTA